MKIRRVLSTKKPSKLKAKSSSAGQNKPEKVRSILVTQPKPENDKSPYTDLGKKLGIKIDFRPFIHVEGVSSKEFRQERINILDYSAVIMTSRNSVDHFFRLCNELRVNVDRKR